MYSYIVLFALIGLSFAERRKLSTFVNPGCPSSECSNDKNVLVHVVADGKNDTLHHIWDFTYKPTVFLGLTPRNTSLSINWTEFHKGQVASLNFSSPPYNVFSFVLDQLIEFNDPLSEAAYNPMTFNKSDVFIFGTHNFNWKFDGKRIINTTEVASVVMEGKFKHHGHHKTNGTVLITLSAFGRMEHSSEQPHLIHSVNVTQVEMVLDGLSTSDKFKPRFAVGLSIATNDPESSPLQVDHSRSLDDEHSPGVFTVGSVKSKKGYLTWREVAYTTKEHLMTSSVGLQSALYPPLHPGSFNHTVFSALNSSTFGATLRNSSIFIFGVTGDVLYTSTNHLSWTFLGGVGKPVEDNVSFAAVIIVVLGIGVPLVIIPLIVIYILCRRINKQSHDIVFAEN